MLFKYKPACCARQDDTIALCSIQPFHRSKSVWLPHIEPHPLFQKCRFPIVYTTWSPFLASKQNTCDSFLINLTQSILLFTTNIGKCLSFAVIIQNFENLYLTPGVLLPSTTYTKQSSSSNSTLASSAIQMYTYLSFFFSYILIV